MSLACAARGIPYDETTGGSGRHETAHRVEAESTEEMNEPPPLASPSVEGFLMSPQQERLFKQQDRSPQAFISRLAIKISGPLEMPALLLAVGEVAASQEALQTLFLPSPSLRRTVQVVAGPAPRIARIDLTGLGRRQRQRAAEELLVSEGRQLFDLARGPSLRVLLLQLEATEQLAIFHLPSLCADLRSLNQLFDQITSAYASRRPLEPHERPMPYTQFAAWQRQLLDLPEAEEERLVWQALDLSGTFPEQLPLLPEVAPKQQRQNPFRPGKARRILEAEKVSRLQQEAERLGLPTEALLLAAWGLVLWRSVAPEPRLSLFRSCDGRGAYEELRATLGLFEKYLPVVVGIQEETGFEGLARRVARRLTGADDDQEYFDSRIWTREGGEFPADGLPLGFSFDPCEEPRQVGEVQFSIAGLHCVSERFAARLACQARHDALRLELVFDRGLYPRPVAEMLLGRFEVALFSALDRPQADLGCLEILSLEERRQLLYELNQGAPEILLPGVGGRPVYRYIEAACVAYGDRVAVSCEGRSLTYAQLGAGANRMARHLQRRGAGPERRIAVALERSTDLVLAVLAVLKAGAVYVPLDVEGPPARGAQMMADVGADLVLIDRVSSPWAKGLGAEGVPMLALEELGADLLNEEASPLPTQMPPQGLAYAIFTSGSTGRPKAAGNTHEALTNRLLWMQERYRLEPRDVVLHKTPVAFDVSVWELLWALMTGARLEVARPGGHRDPAYLLGVIRDRGVSVVHFVPSMLKEFLGQDGVEDCPALRLVVASGETLSPALSRLFHQHLDASLENLYGPTEAAVDVTAHRTDGRELVTVPIGRPISNLRAFVVDERFRAVPWGREGELCLAGVGLARGYLGEPRETASAFLPDPFSGIPGTRLYRTGDRCRWRGDRRLDILGRLDQQLKIRGWRVEPGEVEAALLEHPAVSAASVLGQSLEGSGTRLVAYVEGCSRSDPPAAAELRDFLVGLLPPPLIPGHFVSLEALPRLPSGKVDRKALPTYRPRNGTVGQPRTRAEEELVAIWSQVLAVPAVGPRDDFLALGGDSILAMQVVAGAHRAGLHLVPGDLFETASLAELALRARPLETVPVSAPEVGPVPLTPAQHWFFDLDLPRPERWNQSLLLRLRQELEPALLRRALEAVSRRHPAFRLRFVRTDQGWIQELDGEPALGWAVMDLEGLDPERVEGVVEKEARRLHGSLDLERGPLFRALYCRVLGGGFLACVGHHLIVDSVSWRVLLQDLEAAYEVLKTGGTPEARPAPSPFSWARGLEEMAAAEDPETAVRNARLGRPWGLAGELPSEGSQGLATGPGREGNTRVLRRTLDTTGTENLVHRSSRRLRTDPRELLLTALAVSLRQWTDAPAARLDLEGHGRAATEDLSDAMGWFTSRSPLLLMEPETVASGDSRWAEELAVVKRETALSSNGDQAFAALRYTHPSQIVRRRFADIPRAQVSFNYLGRLDAVLGGSELFDAEDRGIPGERHPENSRPVELEIDAWVLRGRLSVTFTYSEDRFRRQTIEAFASSFFDHLRALLAAPAVLRLEDFPATGLTQAELVGLALACGGAEKVEQVLPLAGSQEGMLLYLLVRGDASVGRRWETAPDPTSAGPDEPVFFNQLHCELQGSLRPSLLQQVFQESMRRHQVLRTSFHWQGLPVPMQVVGPLTELPWKELDWSHSELDPGTQLEDLLVADHRRAFRLEEAPLIRLTLIRLGPQRHRLLLSYHHLILDGWSISLLLREAFAAYESRAVGASDRASTNPPVKASQAVGRSQSFSEYAEWQRSQDRLVAEEFWRRRLEGVEASPRLYLDRGPAATAGRFRHHREALSPRRTQLLKERARELRLTLSSLVQGAWAIVLGEATGRKEVVFGTVVSGREGGFESTVGLLINALPMRARIRPEASVELWFRELQQSLVEARELGYCSLEEIHRWAPQGGQMPLFESLVVFENYPVEETLLEGRADLRVRDIKVEERTNYPLALFAFPGSRLGLELVTDTGRFDRESAEILLSRLEGILERVAQGRDLSLGQLMAPDEEQRQQVLDGWNPPLQSPPLQSPPRALAVERAFSSQARRDPAAPALLLPSSDGTQLGVVSYGRLHRRVGRLAEELVALGAGPETLIALRFDRSPELLTCVLAVLTAGAAFLPLDLSWPPRRCRQILEESGALLLLTVRDLDPEDELGAVPIYFLEVEGELAAARPAQLLLRSTAYRSEAPDADALAYLLYTSGSTGRPKGVEVSRRALAAHCQWAGEAFALAPRDRVLQLASLAFDASLEEIFPALARGAALVLRTDAMLSCAQAFWQACDRWGVTVADLPTVLWHSLEADPESPPRLPRSLRLIVLGGERACPQAVHAWRGRFGGGVRLLNTYGPTEATVVATAAELPVKGPAEEPDGEALPEVPLGRALPYARAYVLDPEGKPVPPGVAGELVLAGAGLARGYRGRPAATARRFVPDPWGGGRGSRMLRTGDLARFNLRGDLQFLGRRDRQIKIRGIRIELGEVEAVLTGHPLIREAYVEATHDEDSRGLAAFYAPAELSAPELASFLRQQLPESMVPIELVGLAELPRGVSGKVEVSSLPRAQGPRRAETRRIEPRNETEAAVAAVFEEVLGLEGVGALDNFFDLGGHSLLATRLVATIQDLFEVDLPLRLVFESPTVERLAAAVATLILDELERLGEEEPDDPF